MQGSHLFEYAVIRVVPRVEREEFLNVGVVLYCPGLAFLQVLFAVDRERLRHFCSMLDLDEVEKHLEAFDSICAGKKEGGPIALLDRASRFRWLTATRSTVVQCSKVHPGLCTDAGETLRKLYEQMVL